MSSLSRKSCTNDIQHWPHIGVGCMCECEWRVLRSVVSHRGSLIADSKHLYNTKCASVRNPNTICRYTDDTFNGFIWKAESDRIYPVINSSWFVDDYQLPKWLSNKPIHSVHSDLLHCAARALLFLSFLSVLSFLLFRFLRRLPLRSITSDGLQYSTCVGLSLCLFSGGC